MLHYSKDTAFQTLLPGCTEICFLCCLVIARETEISRFLNAKNEILEGSRIGVLKGEHPKEFKNAAKCDLQEFDSS